MEWYNLLMGFLGVIGGGAGFISIYQAKSNKQTIDISNLSSIIQEERNERQQLRKEYDEYKASVDERIRMFKIKFDNLEQANHGYKLAIYEAYKCRFPQKTCDCPVIKALDCKSDADNKQDNSN